MKVNGKSWNVSFEHYWCQAVNKYELTSMYIKINGPTCE